MTFCLGEQSLEEGVAFVTLSVLCDLRHISRCSSVLLWRKGTEEGELERSPWLLGVLSTFSGVYRLAAMSKDPRIFASDCQVQIPACPQLLRDLKQVNFLWLSLLCGERG